jgi:transposase
MSHDDLRAQYEQLKAQIAELQEGQLARDNPEVRELLQKMQTLTDNYDQKLSEVEAQMAELKRELFGPKADKLTREQQDQMNQLLQDMEADAQVAAPESAEVLVEEGFEKRDKKKGGRRLRHPLPEELETVTTTLEPELAPCSCCGEIPHRIGEEVTEEIDRIPAKLIRRRTVRPKYACGCGESGVEIAPLPPRLIPQSRLGLGLAVHILLSRFDDHLSFYRLEQQFRERHGIFLPRQQMIQWVEHIANWLRPLYDLMWKVMLAGGYLQVDETPVKVLDPEVEGKTARGFLWFYAVPVGDVVLEFDLSRGLAPVQRRLAEFVGTIQTDAYEVYQSLSRKQTAVERIGCLAHARRYMYQAVRENLPDAAWFVSQIRLLYRIENELRELPPAECHARRLEQAPQIWDAMKARAEELKPKMLPKSTMGKAINYFLNDFDALTGYLRDGRFRIDNNLVENAIRPAAVGRRRWLFIGHPDAGWRSAVIYSILLSCRRRGINPEEYLADVLARIPSLKTNQLEPLLPANWKPPVPNSA